MSDRKPSNGETLSGQSVIVTGMHRSGTSMVAAMLEAGGLSLGPSVDLKPPARDNPNGFFEHEGLVSVADDVLEAWGAAWDVPPAKTASTAVWPEQLAVHARSLLDGLATEGPWGWKDPRVCLTLPFWRSLIDDPLLVICVRNPIEVAVSLKRRNQCSYRHGLGLWVSYYRQILADSTAEERLVTHYESHFSGGREDERVRLFCGLSKEADFVPSDRLRKNRADLSLADAGVDAGTIALYERLCEEANFLPSEGGGGPSIHRAAADNLLARTHLAATQTHVRSLEKERAKLQRRFDDLEREVQDIQRDLADLTASKRIASQMPTANSDHQRSDQDG